jgi:hypothetical protein
MEQKTPNQVPKLNLMKNWQQNSSQRNSRSLRSLMKRLRKR